MDFDRYSPLSNLQRREENVFHCTHKDRSFVLPVKTDMKAFACRVRYELLKSYTEKKIQEPSSNFEMLVQFMRFIAGSQDSEGGVASKLYSQLVGHLEERYLQGKDIHSRVVEEQDICHKSKENIIKCYSEAMHMMRWPLSNVTQHILAASTLSKPKSTYTIFGGQGNTQDYFSEFRSLYAMYGSLLDDLIAPASLILGELLNNETVADQYPHGLDFRKWLEKPETTPNSEYLLSAPVSFPLIALGQLAIFYTTCRIWQLTPGEVLENLGGSTGHSQGIIVATSIATCKTWYDFMGTVRSCLVALFFIGCRSQQHFPLRTSWQKRDHYDADLTDISCMMNIMHLSHSQLEAQAKSFNQYVREDKRVAVALINGPTNIVCGGPHEALASFASWLESKYIVRHNSETLNERVPSMRFLPITAPFHTFYLADTCNTIVADLVRHEISIKPSDLLVSVYDPKTGRDLREVKKEDLFPTLISAITTEMVDWPNATTFPTGSCLIDFGPGGINGIGALLHRSSEGTGTRVILAGPLTGSLPRIGYRPDLFNTQSTGPSQKPVDWQRDFHPSLLIDVSGRIMINTKMSRVLGTPPLMVAGMTPTTVHPEFVAATIKAGYHIEMAAGGYHKENDLVMAIHKIEQLIPAGKGITINVIYSSPRQIQWQIPLIKRLILQGSWIDGITVGAGVPSSKVAAYYINELGIKHISFKPGNANAIADVISIAKAHPEFPILLQWTGGRGGGHHSREDFHAPILLTYAEIRRCPNVILIAGSGFGGADDTYPYLTGSWSSRFNRPPMPFDGILLGSRMMVSEEARTSLVVKQAIVACPGVEDAMWDQSKHVITVKSEMGQPIHKIATRGVQLWAEIDEKIFSLPKSSQLPELQKQKAYLIERLNKDFQKVWFGHCFSTGKAVDLEHMTYYDVAHRMVSLLYLRKNFRWIDLSFRRIFGDFVRRIEERLPLTDQGLAQPVFSNYDNFDEPFKVLCILACAYKTSQTQLINREDQEFFLSICSRTGQKPVPFIPVIDGDFETWFKKDSLWQSEFIEAVVDEDVQRICILQGPVAVKYATSQTINEPVKTILDRINDNHINRIKWESYSSTSKAIPRIESFGHYATQKSSYQKGLSVVTSPNVTTFKIPRDIEELPSPNDWLELVAGKKISSRYALFTSKYITSGHTRMPNPLQQVFMPIHGLSVIITEHVHDERVSVAMEIDDSIQLDVTIPPGHGRNIVVNLHCYENAGGKPLSLEFCFSYYPESPYMLLHEELEGRTDRIFDFYKKVWLGKTYEAPIFSEDLHTCVVNGDHFFITRDMIVQFMAAVGNGIRYTDKEGFVPMDFAIVIGWKAIVRALLLVKGDLLRLVHLSNRFRMYSAATPLKVGDETESSAQITSIGISETGKTVKICTTISRLGAPIVDIVSRFLYRGTYTNFAECFSLKKEDVWAVRLNFPSLVKVLLSKDFITWSKPLDPEDLVKQTLTFELETFSVRKSKDLYSHLRIKGSVFALSKNSKAAQEIGTVYYDSCSAGKCEVTYNPVMGYLERHGTVLSKRSALESSGLYNNTGENFTFIAPIDNGPYARASGDYNPIHTLPAFARYAALPGPITHGMHVSAIIRSIVEMHHAGNDMSCMRDFSATFTGIVKGGDSIEVHINHVAMLAGNKILEIQARNAATQEKVLVGECEIELTPTAYIFTGQGSQEMGMGMDLYAISSAARDVWDRADKYYDETYGFRISEIVRKNPKSLRVHFGGKRGAAIRQNYTALTYELVSKAGIKKTKPLLDIDSSSFSYTHCHPNGLLFSTAFAQPAITVMEKASFEDLASRGLISNKDRYAGHSLGEYAALCAIGNIMPLEQFLSVVFYRGLSMQVAVDRDERGRSEFGMLAVDPSRVIKSFDINKLERIVRTIAKTTNSLLEVVNYNVQDKQYVCAGTLRNLQTLTLICNDLATSVVTTSSLDHVISNHIASLSERDSKSIKLNRGKATIPLDGIDVPFHSSFLRPNLSAFRKVLEQHIRKDWIDPEKLIDRYVPNVTAKVFSTSKESFEYAYSVTKSEKLKYVLDKWEEDDSRTDKALGSS